MAVYRIASIQLFYYSINKKNIFISCFTLEIYYIPHLKINTIANEHAVHLMLSGYYRLLTSVNYPRQDGILLNSASYTYEPRTPENKFPLASCLPHHSNCNTAPPNIVVPRLIYVGVAVVHQIHHLIGTTTNHLQNTNWIYQNEIILLF